MSYTYMLFMNDDTTNFQYQGNNPFDPEAEWARSTDFQRHTLRFNGIWRLPYDISVSGAYLFGSGNYYATTVGAEPVRPHRHDAPELGHDGAGGAGNYRHRRRPTATSCRCAIASTARRDRGRAKSRRATRCADCRCIASTFACRRTSTCRAGCRLTGIAEVFNVTNHANYGAYNGQLNTTTFGQPRQSLLNAYQPRVMQLASNSASEQA